MVISTATLGYPSIGKKREVKKALEAFWSGNCTAATLLETARKVESASWRLQQQAGIDEIGIGDATLYDRVLDWSVRLGIIPDRFRKLSGLEQYFAMARGQKGIPALEMTKWFDTNYHYLVPEIAKDLQPADFSDFLDTVRRARTELGDKATPILLGPITLLRLSRLDIPLDPVLAQLSDRYCTLLTALKALGVPRAQISEPALVLGDSDSWKPAYQSVYATLAATGMPLHLTTYFDDLGKSYPWVIELPVASISLDLTRGQNLALIEKYGFPTDKRLGAGIVDGRNIWQIRPQALLPTLETLQAFAQDISIQPSSSLQFLPCDASKETHLPDALSRVLSFAEQKLTEVVLLARTIAGENTSAQLAKLEANWDAFHAFSPCNLAVQQKLRSLTANDFDRPLPYSQRLNRQIPLPPLPTTTIGSFPQTAEVRQLRVKYKRGELTEAEYQAAIDAQIASCIRRQEEIGLDVLVHGEFERTDMVEYFGAQLQGFAFTEHGWVQSYGSRCVRPPIIYGDVARVSPMTVREFKVAQSLTVKPVKGMLTGPVTIINWSYTRTDISKQEQAFQIALALREEIADLETSGAMVIQVDEPALREGLPLKPERWRDYLSWAVDAFRLTAAIAQPQTQIHTHMCYSEFGDIIQDIQRLDADVLSIENSRSNNRTLKEVTEAGYAHQIGNGVYDIHSPVVPTTEEILQQLKTGIANLPLQQIWVNPDCGLKTRRWEEVMPALQNMVSATKQLRSEIAPPAGIGTQE